MDSVQLNINLIFWDWKETECMYSTYIINMFKVEYTDCFINLLITDNQGNIITQQSVGQESKEGDKIKNVVILPYTSLFEYDIDYGFCRLYETSTYTLNNHIINKINTCFNIEINTIEQPSLIITNFNPDLYHYMSKMASDIKMHWYNNNILFIEDKTIIEYMNVSSFIINIKDSVIETEVENDHVKI